jgi:hypothetical protein
MGDIRTAAPPTANDGAISGWAWVGLALAVALFWIVAFENSQLLQLVGAKAAASGNFFHELFHDGRHLLGVPCH